MSTALWGSYGRHYQGRFGQNNVGISKNWDTWEGCTSLPRLNLGKVLFAGPTLSHGAHQNWKFHSHKDANLSKMVFFHDPLVDSAASKSSSVWVMFWFLYPCRNLQNWGQSFWTFLWFSWDFDLAKHFSCSVRTVEICGQIFPLTYRHTRKKAQHNFIGQFKIYLIFLHWLSD